MFAGGKQACMLPEWRVPDSIIRVVEESLTKRMFGYCAASKAGNEMTTTAIN